MGDEECEPTTQAGAIGVRGPSWEMTAPRFGAKKKLNLEGVEVDELRLRKGRKDSERPKVVRGENGGKPREAETKASQSPAETATATAATATQLHSYIFVFTFILVFPFSHLRHS